MAANPNPSRITAASWWLMEQLLALQPGSRNGGIYANKPGYHNTRAANSPNDYSVREAEDKGGPADKAAAYDWTFPDAQRGDYRTIARYSTRLLASGRDKNDPRLDGWREFFGQTDTDTDVEGWNFRQDRATRSDKSHLWHIHLSEDRSKVTSMDNKRKLLSVLRGETVGQWRGASAAKAMPAQVNDLHVVALHGGLLGHTDRTSGGVWRQSWGSVFGAAGADLTAVSDVAAAGASRQMHVLALHNGKISHTVRSPQRTWTEWRDTGAPPATTRIAAAVVAGDLHVIAVHQGRLAHSVRRGTTGEWTGVFQSAGTGLSTITDLTAAATGNQLQVLVLHDGRIAHTTRRADGTWNGWLDVFKDGGTGELPGTTRLSAAQAGGDLHLITLHEGRLGHTDRRTTDGVWRQSWGSVFGAAGADLKNVTDVAAAGTGAHLQVLALHNGRLAHTVRSPERIWTKWLDVYKDGGTGDLPSISGALSLVSPRRRIPRGRCASRHQPATALPTRMHPAPDGPSRSAWTRPASRHARRLRPWAGYHRQPADAGWRSTSMGTLRSRLGLTAALVAGAALLVLPSGGNAQPVAPVTAAVAWPQAVRGTVQPTLPDGAEYRPGLFLDARTSIGTAATPDDRFLRLVRVGADGTVRQLRRLPRAQHPSFQALTATGDVLAWVESTDGGTRRLFTAGLRDTAAPRELTADLGRAEFYQSEYDLVIAGGRVHWVAADRGDVTQVRSVALSGGAVRTRSEPGTWKLSAYPWLVNGVNDSSGSTLLRNLDTGRDSPVRGAGARAITACSPVWCRVASLTRDGENQIELMRPDGTGRERLAGDTAATVIVDVAPLDRFEVLARVGPNSELTGNNELIAVEIATRRTVEISPDAGSVSYRGGMLWWSAGNLDAIVWHALDLRTI